MEAVIFLVYVGGYLVKGYGLWGTWQFPKLGGHLTLRNLHREVFYGHPLRAPKGEWFQADEDSKASEWHSLETGKVTAFPLNGRVPERVASPKKGNPLLNQNTMIHSTGTPKKVSLIRETPYRIP